MLLIVKLWDRENSNYKEHLRREIPAPGTLELPQWITTNNIGTTTKDILVDKIDTVIIYPREITILCSTKELEIGVA